MAKNNRNKPKNQPSWIQQQLQQNGEAFIGRLTTDIIRKNALKIFKDIASGNIDYNRDWKYFGMYTFTYNLFLSAQDNAYYTWTCCSGIMTMLNSGQADSKMVEIANELKLNYDAYSTVMQGLNNILSVIQASNGEHLDMYLPPKLQELTVQLQRYRRCFNGYFITVGRPDDGRMRIERREIPNGESRSDSYQGYV